MSDDVLFQHEVETAASPGCRYWVELTYPETHATGKWAFGKGLFSPQESKSGAKLYREMLVLEPDDVVFHIDAGRKAVVGVSLVAAKAETGEETPSDAGPWSDVPSYRVPLKEYRELDPTLPAAAFLSEKHEAILEVIEREADVLRKSGGAKQLFYERAVPGRSERSFKQGAYLTEAPPRLVAHMANAYLMLSDHSVPHVDLIEIERELEPSRLSVHLRCWKIAPGEGAWNWDACREGGFIGIGWEEIGDVGAMNREEFNVAQAAAVARHDDWTISGSNQVWRFAHDIAVGDRVVANRGKSEIVGFGRVTGTYVFLPGVRHGHHLPIEWFDTRLRRLPEPNHAFLKTIVGIEREEFDALLALPPDFGGLVSPASHPAFVATTQELLERFDADPTKAFYYANEDELTKTVQEPVQALLREVAQGLAPPLRAVLETGKNLFGRFIKNDHGQGGAWPFYWGAFYPLEGKRTEGCQLFLSANKEGFAYGFAVGNYAGEDRKRLAHNIAENREALAAALCDTINTPDFGFGDENISLGGHLTKGIAGLDLDGWLSQFDQVGPHVQVLLTWDEQLGIERDTLVENITNSFNRLFPLVLLCTSDDPVPQIQRYVGGEQPEVNPPYSLDDLAAETSLPKENLEAWLRAIERKGQAILYGPPGTGKTYVAERLARHLVAGDTGVSELVQFHPAYAYEDFMQGMRPKARESGGLDYPIVDGRFKLFCEKARSRTGVSVLVIDEVNRANVARVFGELMYLLEYRDKSIPLASGGHFGIPANVRLIGTMNTADRSIALVDHALRRRFAFLPLYPDYQMLTDYHAKRGDGYDPAKLIEVLKDLNRKIGDHHYEVGTSFFMRPDIAEELPDVWSMEIEPYLEEYFFDQQATVDTFRWDAVKKQLAKEN